MPNTGSPRTFVMRVNASQSTITDISFQTFRPCRPWLWFLVREIRKFFIDLIQDVARCTWPWPSATNVNMLLRICTVFFSRDENQTIAGFLDMEMCLDMDFWEMPNIMSAVWDNSIVNTLRPRQNGCHFAVLNAFSWMKMVEFRLKSHWSSFVGVQLTIFQRWFWWWLGAVEATNHYLNQWLLVYRRIYVSLGLN